MQNKLYQLLQFCDTRTELFVESFAIAFPNDPFVIERVRLNSLALEVLNYVVQPRIEDLLKLSAAANAVDIAAPWYLDFDLVEELDRAATSVRGSIDRAVKLLENACSATIMLDNAGEAVIDLVLALNLASQGYRVYVTARSEPYELDVTASEVRMLLIDVARVLAMDTRGIEIVETGSRYPAPARAECLSVFRSY